jgi:uncharacterized protein (DUF362 family)
VNTRSNYLEILASQAHKDGGWGYVPDQPAHLEPTCLGILALSLGPKQYGPALTAAKKALDACAQLDGTFRLGRGREQAIWPTSLALFVKCEAGYPEAQIKKTAARLLAIRGRVPDNSTDEDLHDINLKLVGWPWAEGNFSWAEPTAWACLALRRVGLGEHARVQEGIRLLLDRAADEGGINYGNRRIFGRRTEPIPTPTALMLLALQGRADQPRVRSAVQYLMNAVRDMDDLEHLCWARIALTTHRDQPGVADALGQLDARILEGQQQRAETPWVQPAPLRTALTALALAADQRNVFALPPQVPATVQVEAAAPVVLRKPGFFERIGAAFRGMAVKAAGNLRALPPQTSVHIAKATDYNGDLSKILGEQYEHFRAQVPLQGKRVVLKPNLVEYHRDKVINTHPHIVAAVIELCRREGAAEVIVAEGPGHWRNVEYLVSASGLGDVLRHYKVPFVDLNHDEPVKTPNLGRLTGLEYLYLSRTVASAEVLISLPKLKTHHWAGATLSLKNLFGTLPGICYGWPKNELHWRGIDNSITDIALTRTPDLAIVDGLVGMEGDGPLNGTPKALGGLIMGSDPLAVDATCCRLMQLDPEKLAYLVLGAQRKLGHLRENEIQQLGEKIADLAQPFDTVDHFKNVWLGRSA